MVVEGSVWRRDFQVRDADRIVLSALPQTSVISLRPSRKVSTASLRAVRARSSGTVVARVGCRTGFPSVAAPDTRKTPAST